MDRLRKAFEEVREGMPGGWPDERYGQPESSQPGRSGDRPGSLWESGSTGEPRVGREVERPRNPNRAQRPSAHEPPRRDRQPRPEHTRPERNRPAGQSRTPAQPDTSPPRRRAESVPLSDEVRLAGRDLSRSGGDNERDQQLPTGTARVEAARLARVLRSPESLRTAVLLREVLDPPIALRDDRGRG